MSSAADHCRDLVRDSARDRYLASLFAPDEKRRQLFALYALDIEIARIATAVSEPQIGLIRQQWWLDTLDGIYGGVVPAHPVAGELALVVKAAGLPQHALRGLVEARQFDLYDDPMLGLAELEAYLGETSSALIQMAALILAGEAAQAGAEAAGLAGVAYGLALKVHDEPQHLLPPGMDRPSAIAHARLRLAEARALCNTVPPAALPAFLPVSTTELYLGKQGPSQFRRQLSIWWAARHNRF